MTERPEVCVVIAASLDGFIAWSGGAIGAIDGLIERHAAAPPGEDFGDAAFMTGVDARIMGRKTCEAAPAFDL